MTTDAHWPVTSTDNSAHPPTHNAHAADAPSERRGAQDASAALRAGEMDCPNCGAPMPDLKGGHATICASCGYKDSCCY